MPASHVSLSSQIRLSSGVGLSTCFLWLLGCITR